MLGRQAAMHRHLRKARRARAQLARKDKQRMKEKRMLVAAPSYRHRRTEQSTNRQEQRQEATIQAMGVVRARGRTTTGRATRTRLQTQLKRTIRRGIQEDDEVGRLEAAPTRPTSNTGRSRKELRKKATTRIPRRKASFQRSSSR